MAKNLGGCIISRPEPITYHPGFTQGFTLMSDLHFGAANVDYKLINKELAEAKKNGDRVLLNGDVYDSILVKDKRFQPDVLHKRLLGAKDIVNEVIDWSAEVFMPYRDIIDMIGIGNHCTSVEKHNNIDLIKFLISRLESKTHQINYGGYMGFCDYRFRQKNEPMSKGKRFVIYYFHGTGSASANKGTTQLNKKMWVESDVIWLGHYHANLCTSVYRMACPLGGEDPIMKPVRQIITGSYFDLYGGQSQESVRKHGRKSNYAADSGFEPLTKGGTRLLIHFPSTDVPYEVKVLH